MSSPKVRVLPLDGFSPVVIGAPWRGRKTPLLQMFLEELKRRAAQMTQGRPRRTDTCTHPSGNVYAAGAPNSETLMPHIRTVPVVVLVLRGLPRICSHLCVSCRLMPRRLARNARLVGLARLLLGLFSRFI